MRALILGANGQDGSYLCEALLRLGYEVFAVGRDKASRYPQVDDRFHYHALDLEETGRLAEFVAALQPTHCYHFAAVHGAAGNGFEYETNWAAMVRVNLLALHALLEVARAHGPRMRIFYAGSCKIFPAPFRGEIDERTPARATCLYSIGKIAARDLIAEYGRAHGVRGTNLILFNHDSPRRPPQYLLQKIAKLIVAAKVDQRARASVRNLDFQIDWGSAEEFMGIVAELGTSTFVPEVVIASGSTVNAKRMIWDVFMRHGLNPERHIFEELPSAQPSPEFIVNLARLETVARRPKIQSADVLDQMVDALSEP